MKKKFCHIPKTGGVSICKLINRLPGHTIEILDGKKYIYTFVRNPYDRLVSSFFFLKNGGRNNMDKQDKKKYINNYSFSEFVIHKLKTAAAHQKHFRPQTYWIPKGASFIGKFESMENDLEELKKYVPIKGKLPHLNKSNHKDFKEYYNEEISEIVYEVYKNDFIKFDYDKKSYIK